MMDLILAKIRILFQGKNPNESNDVQLQPVLMMNLMKIQKNI